MTGLHSSESSDKFIFQCKRNLLAAGSARKSTVESVFLRSFQHPKDDWLFELSPLWNGCVPTPELRRVPGKFIIPHVYFSLRGKSPVTCRQHETTALLSLHSTEGALAVNCTLVTDINDGQARLPLHHPGWRALRKSLSKPQSHSQRGKYIYYIERLSPALASTNRLSSSPFPVCSHRFTSDRVRRLR